MKILVTGSAGFIGFHTARRLLDDGFDVIGIDNLNPYYDVGLKKARLKILTDHSRFRSYENDLTDRQAVEDLFQRENPERVIHLAAQPGVRYSLEHPHEYIQSNVVGFLNVIEGCRHHRVQHLVFASTSSIYGLNTQYPFDISQSVDHPMSLYAATKKDNEMVAHAYAHLYRIPATGLRFFTVYGPWGRPDMSYFLFTKKILEGKPIDVFNSGNMARDFTYVDDIVEGVVRVVMKEAKPDPDWSGDSPDPSSSSAPYRIYNIGSNASVPLMDFIREIEKNLGKKAQLNMMPMQPGDFQKSHADVSGLIRDFGYQPRVKVAEGIKKFVDWYLEFYGAAGPQKNS